MKKIVQKLLCVLLAAAMIVGFASEICNYDEVVQPYYWDDLPHETND